MSMIYVVVQAETAWLAIVRTPHIAMRTQPHNLDKMIRCQPESPQPHTLDNPDVTDVVSRKFLSYLLKVASMISHGIPFINGCYLCEMSSSENKFVRK